jgi:hypothetical protein
VRLIKESSYSKGYSGLYSGSFGMWSLKGMYIHISKFPNQAFMSIYPSYSTVRLLGSSKKEVILVNQR